MGLLLGIVVYVNYIDYCWLFACCSLLILVAAVGYCWLLAKGTVVTGGEVPNGMQRPEGGEKLPAEACVCVWLGLREGGEVEVAQA